MSTEIPTETVHFQSTASAVAAASATPDIRYYPPEQVYSNPWQPRIVRNEAHINSLAISIKEKGLLQIPIGRIHPQSMDCVQLAFGHNRFAAWQIARPGEPFPVEIRALSDLQMSDYAATENGQRDDLAPIEKARAIQKRMADFGLNQLEAGAPFGYKVQGSVGNLLGLLKLPESIQLLIGDGGLPERHARGLLKISRALPHAAEQIAAQVAKAENKDAIFDDELREILHQKGRRLWDMPFKKDALLPIAHVAKAAQKIWGDKTEKLPPCKGCQFFIEHNDSEYCMNAGCYAVKCEAFAWQDVERLAKKLGIELLQDGEKSEVIFNGKDSRQDKLAASAIASKHESLRLGPSFTDNYGYARERVLGSKFVELYTTNLAELKKAIKKLPKEKKKSASDALEKSRAAGKREQNKQKDRRDECRRLMRAAAPHVAKAFNFPEKILDVMIPTMSSHHFAQTSTQVEARAKKANAGEKAQIVAEIVLAQSTHAGQLYSGVTPSETAKKIETLAASLKVKLPAGWKEESHG